MRHLLTPENEANGSAPLGCTLGQEYYGCMQQACMHYHLWLPGIVQHTGTPSFNLQPPTNPLLSPTPSLSLEEMRVSKNLHSNHTSALVNEGVPGSYLIQSKFVSEKQHGPAPHVFDHCGVKNAPCCAHSLPATSDPPGHMDKWCNSFELNTKSWALWC